MFTEIKRLIKILRVKTQYHNVFFAPKANFALNSVFEGQNKIGSKSWFDGYMGYGSYVGDESIILAKMGRFCSVGHKVTVLTGTHPSRKYVSTNPVFFSLGHQNGTSFVNEQRFKEKIYADETQKYGVIIGNDVWIGYNATIMGGVTIGDGAIIASGALVTSDVEPYSIVAGQPAKVIRKRFTEEQIEWLNEFAWWDKPIEWLKEHAKEFDDIEKFMVIHSKTERKE